MGICCNILQIVVTKLKSGFGKEKAMLAMKLVSSLHSTLEESFYRQFHLHL